MALTISDEQLENINLPPEVQQKALQKAKEGYVMILLEAGEIASGRAGKILGVSRLEVIEMMKQWGISLFDDSQDLEDLAQEVENFLIGFAVPADEREGTKTKIVTRSR